LPPGIQNQFEAGFYSVYSPDDYFDDPIDDLAQDSFEDNYDSMNKYSKAKEKQMKQNKEFDNLRLLDRGGGGGGGGDNENCDDEGITDGEASNTLGILGVNYIVQGFTGIGSNCKDTTIDIIIFVDGPKSPPPVVDGQPQPQTFQPNEPGTWIILAQAAGQFTTRTVLVAGVDAGDNFNLVEFTVGQLDATTFTTPTNGTVTSIVWTGADEILVTLSDTSIVDPTFTAPSHGPGGPGNNSYMMTLTATFTDMSQASDTVTVTVTGS